MAPHEIGKALGQGGIVECSLEQGGGKVALQGEEVPLLVIIAADDVKVL